MTTEISEIGRLTLADYIRPGDLIVWGQGNAEPLSLTEALAGQRRRIGGARCFTGISSTAAVRAELCDYLSFTSYSGAGANRALAAAGILDILPAHYSELPEILGDGPLRADVLFLSLPPAAPDGSYGLGLGADYAATLIGRARMVIAEVNDQVPDVGCDRRLSRDDIDVIVHVSHPPAEYPQPAGRGVDDAIATHVAGLIPDGATLQLGIGAIPSAIASRLHDHRDLGIHSGVATDAVAGLIEAGVVTGARKSMDAGLVVTGFLMGTQRLIALAAADPSVQLRDTSYTHDPAVLAAQHRFVALNSAIEVDLTGAVNCETAAGRYVGAVGGATDFLRAAARSEGGVPVIALPSTAPPATVPPATARSAAGTVSRIVAGLSGPASQARADAGVIVTEYGVADLRGLTLPQRRARMLAIAHPDHVEALERGRTP